jgi:hypothetical protein
VHTLAFGNRRLLISWKDHSYPLLIYFLLDVQRWGVEEMIENYESEYISFEHQQHTLNQTIQSQRIFDWSCTFDWFSRL